MIVYATHAGGKYLPLDESLRVQPEGKRNLYVNITNHCNCACTFCLRTMKHMAEQPSLWFKGKEPTVEEVKLDDVNEVFEGLIKGGIEGRRVIRY